MKLKHMILVSLILAILTIGAVSASEDIMSEDTLNADTGDESISISDEDSQLNEEDDGGSDENDGYVEEEDPCDIFIYDSADIDDDDYEFASVELKTDADGNISLKVNNQELVNKELSQFTNRYLDADFDDVYIYNFYFKDFDYEFVADVTYDIEVSYFDGENTYTQTGQMTPYKLNKIEQDGITVEIRSRGDCLIDFNEEEGFVFITAPAGADGNVTVIFDDGEKYSKTLSLNELYYDSEMEEYSVCVRHIDSNMEPGTHTIYVTYDQDGIEPISLSGNVTFSYENKALMYKTYINPDEVNVDADETVLISLLCPEGSTGKFVISIYNYEGFSNNIEHPITEQDGGKTIAWNMSALGITEKGKYSLSIYHYISDEEYDGIGEGMLKIVDNDEFRAKSSDAYVIYDETEIISVFCPTGNAEAKITFKIQYEHYEEIGSIDYIVKEDDVGYVGFNLKFFNITKAGQYYFEVLKNDEHLDNLNVNIKSPIYLPEDVDMESESDAVAYIDLPTDKLEGRIVITINNEECFNEYLSQIPNNCIWDSYDDETSYRIYLSNLAKEVEAGTYNVTVTYYFGEKSYSQSAMVEFYKRNIAEDEDSNVKIVLFNKIDGSFARAIVPYNIEKGVFSVLIEDIEHLKIDIATYDNYYSDESGKIYELYPYMLNPEVKGTANVKIIYIVDGEDVIQVNGTLKFTDDETQGSELYFNQDEITIEEGSSAIITFTTIGCSVSQENIAVDNSDAEISLNDNEITISGLTVGTYTLAVTTSPEEGYNAVTEYLTITVTEKEIVLIDPEFRIDIDNVELGSSVVVRVSAVEAFSGVVTVVVDGHDVLVSVNAGSGVNSTDLGLAVKDGYVATLSFDGNDEFKAGSAETTFNVTAKETPEPAVLIDPKLELVIENVEDGTPVTIIVKTNATFTGDVKISSDIYNGTVKVNNGEGNTTINLPIGNYTFKAIFNETEVFKGMEVIVSFNVTSKNNGSSNASDENNTPSGNGTNNTVPVKITAKDLNVIYSAGSKYTVTVYGADGKVAAGVKVTFLINGKTFKTVTTDAKGIATVKITQKPGTYKITTKALGKEVTKKLTVKHVLKLKKVKVKRSAKKLVLKATLSKVNGKYLKGKKITFKFKGKKYTANTNKKGVAKVTIKKKVLKKLKKGKKVTYQATYLKDTVKYSVKVKK
ncbi:Ig-like domain-containing protein [Methanobrevibacter sp.]